MRGGITAASSRTRRIVRATAALLVAGAAFAAGPGRPADASPQLVGQEAAGACPVNGTVSFPNGIQEAKPAAVTVSAFSPSCTGLFVSGSNASISFQTTGSADATCAGLAEFMQGAIAFSTTNLAGFSGTALLTGDMTAMVLTTQPLSNTTGDTFEGVVALAVTTVNATTECTSGQPFTLTVTGALLLGSA